MARVTGTCAGATFCLGVCPPWAAGRAGSSCSGSRGSRRRLRASGSDRPRRHPFKPRETGGLQLILCHHMQQTPSADHDRWARSRCDGSATPARRAPLWETMAGVIGGSRRLSLATSSEANRLLFPLLARGVNEMANIIVVGGILTSPCQTQKEIEAVVLQRNDGESRIVEYPRRAAAARMQR